MLVPDPIDPMFVPVPVALLGAGGKMGCHLTDNLMNRPEYDMRYVETGVEGIANLAARGLTPTLEADAVGDAEIVIFALPDNVVGSVAHSVVPTLKSGAIVICLDPSVAYAGGLPARSDVGYFVTHPCHPSVFSEETGDARRDYFGGVQAKQHIVCALVQGTDLQYKTGEQVARMMYAPVINSHRITLEQMTLLQPTIAETVVASCITVIREAMDEVVRRGVPEAAARDFVLGHVHIPLAILFGEVEAPFSAGAQHVINNGKQILFKEDWKRVFEAESIHEQVQTIISTTSTEV